MRDEVLHQYAYKTTGQPRVIGFYCILLFQSEDNGHGEVKCELSDDVHNVYWEGRWVINCRWVMIFLTTVLQQSQSSFIWNLRAWQCAENCGGGGSGLFQGINHWKDERDKRIFKIAWCLPNVTLVSYRMNWDLSLIFYFHLWEPVCHFYLKILGGCVFVRHGRR
jgi:hypothetical protein